MLLAGNVIILFENLAVVAVQMFHQNGSRCKFTPTKIVTKLPFYVGLQFYLVIAVASLKIK